MKQSIETYTVTYSAGESRMHPGMGIDYMMVTVDGTELYAEAVNPTWDAEREVLTDDFATEAELKAEIIRQAIENGIDPKCLKF